MPSRVRSRPLKSAAHRSFGRADQFRDVIGDSMRALVCDWATNGLRLVASVDFDAATELLVLVANEFDQFLIGRKAFIDTHRERVRVRLRIGEGQVDLQM